MHDAPPVYAKFLPKASHLLVALCVLIFLHYDLLVPRQAICCGTARSHGRWSLLVRVQGKSAVPTPPVNTSGRVQHVQTTASTEVLDPTVNQQTTEEATLFDLTDGQPHEQKANRVVEADGKRIGTQVGHGEAVRTSQAQNGKRSPATSPRPTPQTRPVTNSTTTARRSTTVSPVVTKASPASCPRPDEQTVCCRPWNKALAASRAVSRQAEMSTRVLGTSCKRILLVVIFNWPYYQHVPNLRYLYAKVVTDMVMYGPEEDKELGILPSNLEDGFKFHRAILQAILAFPDYDGYLWMGDDVFLNYPMVFSTLSGNDTLWSAPPLGVASVDATMNSHPTWAHWYRRDGLPALASAYRCAKPEWKRRHERAWGCPLCSGHRLVDVGYVPGNISAEFAECLFAFRNVIMEMAIDTCVTMVSEKKHMLFSELNEPKKSARTTQWYASINPRNVTSVHPLKLSQTWSMELIDSWLRLSKDHYDTRPKIDVCTPHPAPRRW